MSELKNCPHCGAGESDLEDATMRMAWMGTLTWEEPFEQKVIRCSVCGHLADRDTWNDRPEVSKSLQEARYATEVVREGVEALRRVLREPERV